MSPNSRARPRLVVLLVALCVVPIISVFASLQWLDQQPDETVFLITGAASALVIVAGNLLAILQERRMDEVNRTNMRFSTQWGWALGTSLVALLFGLPWFHDLIVPMIAGWADVLNPDRELVLLAFMAGLMAVVIAQTVSTGLLSVGWSLWKSRPAREQS
jgi:hypothetical protein